MRSSFTVSIVDSKRNRYDKLRKNLTDARLIVVHCLRDRKLTSDNLSEIDDVDVLFVHINDVHSSLNNLSSARSKLIFKYTGGSLPPLIPNEINSGKVFNITYSLDHDGTVDGGKRQDILTTVECNEIKQYLMGKTKMLSFVQGGSLVFQINRLRSQILTPLVTLHLALIDSFDENDNVKFKPLIFDVECKKIFNELKAEDEKDKYKIESKLKELLDKAGEKFKDRDKLLCSSKEECKSKSCVFHELMDRIVGLCQAVADRDTNKLVSFKELYEGHKSSNGVIGEFAEMLEDVAEHIERTN